MYPVCICICNTKTLSLSLSLAHTHTHTHTQVLFQILYAVIQTSYDEGQKAGGPTANFTEIAPLLLALVSNYLP